MSINIDWKDVVKKEAKGNNDFDLGEVQEVSNGLILTQRGVGNKEIFSIPQYKVESYDGKTLRFAIAGEEALNKFMKRFDANSSQKLTREEIDWKDVVKKEAKGNNDFDLGEVQEVSNGLILTQRGVGNKEIFSIPQYKVESYDGKTLRFAIAGEEALNKFMKRFKAT
ncbi:hypothetical protein [Candidatus Nitrosocosmicus franklandus]|uniref:EF-hand domain-containing protein n=1 Tax=Candidatus Nitrosocosmicus franklandianus TaxID=1798806 RepID=A0A484IAP1_9ARCH|nr:hypothetical protein [Candidatus Nitrosocosmicus franklandus]VFJ14323.1 protein of unknown function [Candidatus Nitrosocosmicus franklandus]